jgi:hypothetical protein
MTALAPKNTIRMSVRPLMAWFSAPKPMLTLPIRMPEFKVAAMAFRCKPSRAASDPPALMVCTARSDSRNRVDSLASFTMKSPATRRESSIMPRRTAA